MKPEGKISIIPLAGKITVFAFFVSIIIIIFQIVLLVEGLHAITQIGDDTGTHQLYRGQIFQFCDMVINSLVITLTLYFLIRIFRNLKANRFFDPFNIRFITLIGYITLTGSVLASAVRIISMWLLPPNDSTFTLFRCLLEIRWPGIFFGLIILVIGESFRRGEILQKDNDLTI
jgi:hypothetical protein